MKKKTKNYVNNQDFYNALVDYRKKAAAARAEGKERPPIPNYIGECFEMIAQKFSSNYRFINYRFRDEMVSDAVLNMCKYIESFDPERGTNPFSYFTQTAYHAFIKRIDDEKKYLYTKLKCIENTQLFDGMSERHQHDDSNRDYGEDMAYTDDAKANAMQFISDYEETLRKRKEKTRGVKKNE